MREIASAVKNTSSLYALPQNGSQIIIWSMSQSYLVRVEERNGKVIAYLFHDGNLLDRAEEVKEYTNAFWNIGERIAKLVNNNELQFINS